MHAIMKAQNGQTGFHSERKMFRDHSWGGKYSFFWSISIVIGNLFLRNTQYTLNICVLSRHFLVPPKKKKKKKLLEDIMDIEKRVFYFLH